jgi:hypothetical protein
MRSPARQSIGRRRGPDVIESELITLELIRPELIKFVLIMAEIMRGGGSAPGGARRLPGDLPAVLPCGEPG